MTSSFEERRLNLAGLLAEANADALVVSHIPNIRYLTGFTGSNALLLLSRQEALLYTDPRYTTQSEQQAVGCKVHIVRKGSVWAALGDTLRRRRGMTLGLESDRVTFDTWTTLSHLVGEKTKLQPCNGWVERQRTIKSNEEIECIRQSVIINSKAFERVLRRFKAGNTEQMLAADLEHEMRRLGAEGPAFETIVASGEHAALPHAEPRTVPISKATLLLIDMGAKCQGYASDMTRTVHVGKPPARVRKLYKAVLEAQLAAIDKVAPGVAAGDIDRAARRTLAAHGLDQAFTHSTGHGLGLEIHEAPRLGARAETPLEPGMVITIEPGVYLPGFTGVRIEDTVLVTASGHEVLTPTTKEFLEL